MPFFTYIIQSSKDNSFYKGFTEDPILRLARHNNGETFSTRNLTPWKLVFLQAHPSKRDALIVERKIKCYSREKLFNLIDSDKNILNRFLIENQIDCSLG